jgi:hypothetical protein
MVHGTVGGHRDDGEITEGMRLRTGVHAASQAADHLRAKTSDEFRRRFSYPMPPFTGSADEPKINHLRLQRLLTVSESSCASNRGNTILR